MANGKHATPQGKCEFTQDQVAAEIRKAIPNIESRIGKGGFKLMCSALTTLVNSHEGLTPEFLGKTLQLNKAMIEKFYEDKKEEFPKASKVTIFTAVLAAVIVGNVYGIDPLRLLILIPNESKYDANARNVNANGSVDIGLYQINSRSNPKKTYMKDATYEREKFNLAITALGGFKLKRFPGNIWSYDIFENSIGAALTLVEKMRYTDTTNWKKIYTAYNGSLKDPVAVQYGAEADALYKKETARYSFVIVEDGERKKKERKNREFVQLVPKKIK